MGTDGGVFAPPTILSEEIQELILDIKATAPGEDGITYDQLRAFGPGQYEVWADLALRGDTNLPPDWF
eukprot:5723271-Prorocentrum_lima.AAC.1